jgi:hypothetical protein
MRLGRASPVPFAKHFISLNGLSKGKLLKKTPVVESVKRHTTIYGVSSTEGSLQHKNQDRIIAELSGNRGKVGTLASIRCCISSGGMSKFPENGRIARLMEQSTFHEVHSI